MSDVYSGLLIAGILAGAIIAAVVGIAVLRSKILQTTNTMLDRSLEQTRRELEESEQRCKDDLARMSSKHDLDMAGLRGRIDSMTPAFAQDIATALAALGKRVGDA